jgi:tRNA(Arg) A34 adenosine deaminase TadA
MTEDKVKNLIKECQVEAEKSISSGNTPFGCVIADKEGNIVARAHNTQHTDNDPTAHAEIKALRQLGRKIGSQYLDGYIMFGNAAACTMCAAACITAHIAQFYYGAFSEPRMNPSIPINEVAAKCKYPVEINGPILGEECAAQIDRGRKLLNQSHFTR